MPRYAGARAQHGPVERDRVEPQHPLQGEASAGIVGLCEPDLDRVALEVIVSRRKRDVFEELIDEIRRSQAATDRYDQAVADAVGLNRTDMRCLDVLQREGRLTAGQLADATGLASGAMTTALDRLERRGYARRVRDTDDRRRVLVEITERANHESGRFYGEHAAQAERLYERYSAAQLELLLGFVRGSREFNERQAARVEEETRSSGRPSS